MPRFGMDVTLAYPPEFKLMPEIVEQAKEQARIGGTNFEIIDSKDGMTEACKDADVIYAKSWGPLLTTNDKAEGKKIQDMLQGLDHGCCEAQSRQARMRSICTHFLPTAMSK